MSDIGQLSAEERELIEQHRAEQARQELEQKEVALIMKKTGLLSADELETLRKFAMKGL